MLSRGYLEVLFKTVRYAARPRIRCGACAATPGCISPPLLFPDAAKAHRRLAADGFRVRDLVHMQRPVETEAGAAAAPSRSPASNPGDARRTNSDADPSHRGRRCGKSAGLSTRTAPRRLIDVVIAVADVEEAAHALRTLSLGRAAITDGRRRAHSPRPRRRYLSRMTERPRNSPKCRSPQLPFIVGYAIKRPIAWRRRGGGRWRGSRMARHRRWHGARLSRPSLATALGSSSSTPAALPWRR